MSAGKLQTLGWMLLGAVASAPLVATVWHKFPELERYLFPVIGQLEIQGPDRVGNIVVWHVVGYKGRDDCALDSSEWVATYETPYGKRVVALDVTNQGRPTTNRKNVPAGPFVLGPFATTLSANAAKLATHIESTLFYDCGGERVPASFGRFEIPERRT